ncbi:hypothetical protein LDENG_00203210 [Lucifuga dentata]|nr:hypothetical protein LDENG_00203210 [Lucifuga dentata]
MQSHFRIQNDLLRDKHTFDMWHDYMNLGRLLQQLCGMREMDSRANEGPKKDPRSRSQVIPRKARRDSGSASSLSDISSGSSSECCRFCKQNGESARVYRSHKLKSDDGKIVCPILWSYTCPICAATGDSAHTRRYCPQAQLQEAERMLLETRF